MGDGSFGRSLFFGACLLFLTGCEREEYQQPQQKNLKEVVFASGHVETEEAYFIIAAVDGYIEESNIKEGMVVEDGELLAEVSQETPRAQLDDALAGYQLAKEDLHPNSPKIKELDVQIDVAKKELAQDEKLLKSYKKLVVTRAVSEVDYENQRLKTENSRKDLKVLEDSKKDLLNTLDLSLENADNLVKVRRDEFDNYRLRAKGKSQVLKIYRKEGEYIRKGETLAEMGKGASVIKLFVEEGDINSIDLEQTVELSVNTYSGVLFTGKISRIYPSFDEEQQSFIVEAEFIDIPKRIFSGTQVQANIVTSEKQDALIIPFQSVMSGDQVMTRDKGLVQVELGIQNNEWVEVLSGVTKEDFILVDVPKEGAQ